MGNWQREKKREMERAKNKERRERQREKVRKRETGEKVKKRERDREIEGDPIIYINVTTVSYVPKLR